MKRFRIGFVGGSWTDVEAGDYVIEGQFLTFTCEFGRTFRAVIANIRFVQEL
ncbi:MAG TPA: hypothetical protein VIS96_03690 [Terrimicrobiaceae bacterium]